MSRFRNTVTRGAPILLALFLCALARAQVAPAGNAHPATELLESTELVNPLGDPTPSTMSPREKHAFASRVDLSPWRRVAAHHNGRVKILDTLARETVRAITGRRNYQDFIPETDADGAVTGVEKLGYDPLFTFFDLLAAPDYYYDKPLVHVAYLPAREALIDVSVSDPAVRERWMMLTRLSPELLNAGFRAVAEERGTDAEIARALGELNNIADVLRYGHNNLLLVAPVEGSERWRHVSEVGAETPLRVAFREFGEAWRAGDAERVNECTERIVAELDAMNEGSTSPTRRSIEAAYNTSHPFELGAWMYLVALVALLLGMGTQWRWMIALGVVTLSVGILAHTLGFAARWCIAERLPIQNQFESMTGLALGGAMVGLVLMLTRRQWLFGAASAAVGFLILLAATQTGVPGETIGREAAILNTSWLLKYHVSTVLVSYGLITLGAVMSLFYLALHYFGKPDAGRTFEEIASATAYGLNAKTTTPAGRARLLNELDRAQMTVLQLAFWTLGVGILLGAWWADHSWGRWWAFDPKETWALLTWIVYLIVIHVRFGLRAQRGLVTAWLSIAGFVIMLWTYFGVNLLLPGLHAYA